MMHLPEIHLGIVGDAEVFFFAEGAEPVPWRIDAEPSTRGSARTKVYVDDELVADITVHASCGEDLPTEVQTVAAALVWSRIRAIARDRGEMCAWTPCAGSRFRESIGARESPEELT